MKTQTRLIGVLIGLLAMGLLLMAPGAMAGSLGPGAPDVTTPYYQTFTLLSTRALTTSTTTTYTLSPIRFSGWGVADIFVTGEVSGTDTFTATVQFSADGTNWTDGTYSYLAATTTTSVITGTAGLTATTSTAEALATSTYRLVLSSDTTSFMRVPVAGEYLRIKIDNAGYVTPTIKATFKR